MFRSSVIYVVQQVLLGWSNQEEWEPGCGACWGRDRNA